jgi:tetratricopeptide (TPR) repeat protein
MPFVEGEQGKMIEDLMNKSNEAYKTGDLEESIHFMELAWEELPDSKTPYSESFMIVSILLSMAIKTGDTERLKKWGETILSCSPSRGDFGERECWMGKVEYELGNQEKAMEYFKVAVKKSRGGRCFSDSDEKYRTFYFSSI